MTPFLRELVRDRAGDRCEYCSIPQQAVPSVRFHVEHIIAIQHGGPDHPSNLALSCNRCNFHKGTNLSGRATVRLLQMNSPERVQLRRSIQA